MGLTRAQANKKVRQEALREQLANQGHLQHVVEILDKVRDPDEVIEADMVQRYRLTLDTKLKLINKYLPDVKSVEIDAHVTTESHEDWLKRLKSTS